MAVNESPAVGFVAVQARHPKRDRRKLERTGESHREPLDLDDARQVVRRMGGDEVKPDDLAVAVVTRRETPGDSVP